jgi:hypothetical protein
MFPYVSEEPALFIFYPSSETSADIYQNMPLSSTLKLGVGRSSELSVNIYQTTWRRIPQGSNLHSHDSESLKSRIKKAAVRIHDIKRQSNGAYLG